MPDEICPHCGAPLTGNTIEANPYIEEGYLPSWEAYKKWQAATLNRSLLILELGEGFRTPTVMRWPFEKTAYFNKKAFLCRVNKGICQIPKEIGEKGAGICMDSLEFVRCLAAESAGRMNGCGKKELPHFPRHDKIPVTIRQPKQERQYDSDY